MPATIGRWDPRYWERRAITYRDIEMAKDTLVIQQPEIRRVIVMEFAYEHGKRDTMNYTRNDLYQYGRQVRSDLRVCMESYTQAGGKPIPRTTRRIWQVGWYQPYGSHNRVGWHGVAEWERLVMAQGHLDALNYHYARWLMTRETAAEGM